MMLVLVYLSAVVAANLTVTALGPSSAVWVAFLWVGLDLTTRDALHERWRGQVWERMGALILAGGVLSWVVNASAGPVAIASTVAFLAAAATDAAVYTLLGSRSRRLRVNGSNVLSAAVDSLVFPTLAFGAFLPLIVLGQWTAKVVGGAVWYEVLRALSVRQDARRGARDGDA